MKPEQKIAAQSDAARVSGTIKNKRALKITPIVIVGLLALNFIQGIAFVVRSNQEISMPPVYAADGKTGSITKLVALPRNTQEALAMTNFASNVVSFCLTLDFAGFSDTLNVCKEDYFSTTGYTMFERALNDAGILPAVRTGRGLNKAVLDGIPTLSEPGRLGTEVVYTVEVPIVVERRQVGQSNRPTRQVAIVMLARDNRPQTFDQFRVVQFIIENRP